MIIRSKKFPIGLQLLRQEGSRFFVRCINRTYDSGWIPIPKSKARTWMRILS